MRSGYTTGTCAAAAVQAALTLLVDKAAPQQVQVDLPQGGALTIPIEGSCLVEGGAIAWVIKDAGDDPDVTHGTPIRARVTLTDCKGQIELQGGQGVGRVTKPGLAVAVGEAAINPIPRQMIMSEAQKKIPPNKGVQITIEIPEGERLAKKTLNPKLGIVGGLSVLGTSGIVRPMSEEAYIHSLIPQLDQSLALGCKIIVLTPGGMGERRAKAMGIPGEAIAQTSNFIGAMLQESVKRRFQRILLFGHVGKIIKVAGGIFHTHSRLADGRREILAAHAAMCGASQALVTQIMHLNTVDESVPLLEQAGRMDVYEQVAEWAAQRAAAHVSEPVSVGVIMYALDGRILGRNQQAREWGREQGWKDE